MALAAQEEYARRLRLQQTRAAAGARADQRLAGAKLALLFLLLGLAWAALIGHWFAPAWLLPPAALLVALFPLHSRVLAARARADCLAAFYQRGLARLEDRWAGLGPNGERFRDDAHPYAEDLDLFGDGGLFQLLCGALTPMGEGRLAAWMLAPAPPATIRARQRQAGAARDDFELREQIAALAAALDLQLDPARLAAWAQTPPRMTRGRWLCAALTGVTCAAAVFALVSGVYGPALVALLAEWAVLGRFHHRAESVLARPAGNRDGLLLFARVLERVPGAEARTGPAALRQLARWRDWGEAADTLLGHLLDFTVLYGVHLAFAAEAWRRRHGAQVAAWLDAVGEFEALLSLAAYAAEHPADAFPEIVEDSGPRPQPCFEAAALGHPLLPAATCVRNDVVLDAAARLWLISGSNMSGKSTLLRTVGVTAVLAQMGAPVRAARCRLTPLAVGTRLRTADSLRLGRSGFYAEILRLRQVFELTRGPLPLLYLFDELLEGTNSHDRVRGAAGLLAALLARPTLGLVTTHDLALAALAPDLGPGVRNLHFEDQIAGDDVRFDHRLRDGVVTKSNALALMRIIGLEV